MSKLDEFAAYIMENGPSRVIYNADGDATTSRRAREEYGVIPDVIFIRADGWSLGAPSNLSLLAESIWKREWIGVMKRPNPKAEPY